MFIFSTPRVSLLLTRVTTIHCKVFSRSNGSSSGRATRKTSLPARARSNIGFPTVAHSRPRFRRTAAGSPSPVAFQTARFLTKDTSTVHAPRSGSAICNPAPSVSSWTQSKATSIPGAHGALFPAIHGRVTENPSSSHKAEKFIASWIADGKVETIPFTVHVQRTISQMAKTERRITDDAFPMRFARWHTASPDGKTLAFQAVGHIWLMDMPNGQPRRLTASSFTATEYSPAWSPDGKSVVFASWDEKIGGALWKISPRRWLATATHHRAWRIHSSCMESRWRNDRRRARLRRVLPRAALDHQHLVRPRLRSRFRR